MNIQKNQTYIIRTHSVNKYSNNVPIYKMIINKIKDGLLNITNLPEKDIQNEINSQKNNITDLLQSYKNEKEIKKLKTDKKKLKLKTKLKLI